MGSHPDSQSVFDRLVADWHRDTGWDNHTVIQKLAVAFRHEALGLYALRAFYNQGSGRSPESSTIFSRSLIADYPDSRVACMALDHLLEADESAWLAECNTVLLRNTNTRLRRYALTRQGDFHAAHSKYKDAQRAWFEAWIADPSSGPKLYNKLFAVWLKTDEWFAPSILGIDYLDDRASLPIVKRLAARLTDPAYSSSVFTDSVAALGPAISGGDLEAVCALLQSLGTLWSDAEISDADRAEFGLAVFFLNEKGMVTELPLQESISLRNRFNAHRRKFLESARPYFDALDPSLRALYTLRVANRMIEDVQPESAIEMLEDIWRDTAVPVIWRERLLQSHARTITKELNRPKEAAMLYEVYCSLELDHPVTFSAESAMLFFQCGEITMALDGFKKLELESKSNHYKAMSLYMQGLCRGMLRQPDLEQILLESVAEQYPETEFAPRSLELLGHKSVAENNPIKAMEYFEELHERYSSRERDAIVRQRLESLASSIETSEL